MFNLRGCQCLKNYAELEAAAPGGTPGLCRCDGLCPGYVNPEFLTEAKGQELCSLVEPTGYNCNAHCDHPGAEPKWYASPCSGAGQDTCDKSILAGRRPPSASPSAEPAPSEPAPEPAQLPVAAEPQRVEQAPAEEPVAVALPPAPQPPPPPTPPSNLVPGGLPTWDPKEVYDLRGLKCELKNGKEQCFLEDAQGRELCPDFVTAEWLAFPKEQYLCTAPEAEKFYCTATCQEGSSEVHWGAHEISWCYARQNFGACPPRPSVIPKVAYKLKEWSEPVPTPKPCQLAKAAGKAPPGVLQDLSVGMLTHEPRSMRDTLATYEANGFFDVVPEFTVYANKRTPEIDAELAPYVKKYAPKFRVLGDATNVGIARGIIALTSNATKPYFLFLERDFQLVEPDTCVYEQLQTGVDMLKAGKAHIVRYRHRKKAGRPNWAEKMFRGHEDDVFKGGQPNLFCNHYYWVPEPEKRWPDKIWICNDSPQMYCSDSFYCNWTNNPQMWSVEWWNKEYVERFPNFRANDPYHDLEV